MNDNVKYIFLLFLVISTLFFNCKTSNPVENLIQTDLQGVPEWSIILEDMDEKGFFSKEYFHKYKILTGSGDTTQVGMNEKVTDWINVPRRFYQRNEQYLGMAIASKLPGQETSQTATPPGYQYVGDTRYGEWRTDERGNSFWEFYGKYALFRSLLFGSPTTGLFDNRRVERDDFDSYRRSKEQNRPFFGRKGEYGTWGTETEKAKPSFFERNKQRMAQRRTDFSSRVRSKMGRSSSFKSSRSFGRGK
jgi:hypothetical protein